MLAQWGGPPIVLLCHRRYGKTMLSLVTALGLALTHKNIDIAIICKTREQARNIVRQAMTKLAARAPKQLRPRWVKNDSVWICDHTGSGIYMFGAEDEHFETIRGRTLYAAFVDEAASLGPSSIRNAAEGRGLAYKVRSVLLPSLRDSGGQLVMMTTPPVMPGHDFEPLYQAAVARGRARIIRLSENTDPVGFTVAEALEDCDGDELTYRREYECEFVYDPRRLVIPEAISMRQEAIRCWRPVDVHGDHYVGYDVGGRDLHALIFGTYDPPRDSFHVEETWARSGVSTVEIAAVIKETEQRLWRKQGHVRRYMDANDMLQRDLQLTGLPFMVTKRDRKLAHVNQLRVAMAEGKLTMSPDAEQLWGTIVTAKYNATFTGYERDSTFGHADLLDALTYTYRNIARHEPRKAFFDPLVAEGIIPPSRSTQQTEQARRLQKLFS